MKLVQINCVYCRGSTGHLVQALHRHAGSLGWESLVLFGRGRAVREPGVVRLCPDWYGKLSHGLSAVRGLPYGGCLLATRHLIWRLCREKPDVVHLHCLNGYFVNQYRLLSWLKKKKIPVILTLHAEFPYTANCAHAYGCEKWKTGCGSCSRWRESPHSLLFDRTAESFRRMQAALAGFEKNLTVVSVSDWLCRRAVQSPLLKQMAHRVILNGVDTGIFRYRPEISREKIFLHVTAQFSDEPEHPKGGFWFLELARQMQELSWRFVVAGKYRFSGEIPENVTFLGEIQQPDMLAQLYSAAAVTVVTSRAESFSLVCAESLCCGTPVAGFCAGGPEEISLPEYSRFVPFADTPALMAAVLELAREKTDREKIARRAARRYGMAGMLAQYACLYRELGANQ